MPIVPSLRFDSAKLPPAERFERWRAAMAHYDVAPPPGAAPDSFYNRVDAWFLGNVVVTAGQLSPMRFVRSRALIAADGIDRFNFLMLKEGSWTGDVDGRMLTAGAGQIVLFDLARPFEAVSAETDTISLQITRASIADAIPPGADPHGLVFNGTAGRVLADYFMMLVRRLPMMDESEVADAIRASVGIIRSCMGAVLDAPLGAAQREIEVLHRASRYIDQNLRAPDLSPQSICKAVGVSRSALYRAFAPLSGVADYIRARRLEAIHVLLEGDERDQWNSDIAAGFGFLSAAHFSRAFRQRYGYGARQVRNGKARFHDLAALIDSHAAPDTFRAWVARLG